MPLFIEFNICLAALVLSFWLFFRHKSYFNINRFLLLALLPLAALIPKINPGWPINQPGTFVQNTFSSFNQNSTAQNSDSSLLPSVLSEPVGTSTLTLDTIFWILYGLGLLFFCFRLARQYYKLGIFLQQSTVQKKDGYRLIISSKISAPFSVFRYLVLPKEIEDGPLGKQIISHELIHIQQKHSWDILLANLVRTLCWFNPLAWKWRQLIEQNHEYLVDETLLRQGTDPKSYQVSLLQSQLGSVFNHIGHAYNYSFLKKRIIMMQTKMNPYWAKVRYAFFGLSLLPLLILLNPTISQVAGQTLPGIEDGGILVLFTRQTTDQELDQVASTFQEKGLFLEVIEKTRSTEGLLNEIVIKAGEIGKSSGTSSLHNMDEKNIPANEILEYLWYSDDSGSSSVGPMSLAKINQALQYQDKIEWHFLGFSSSLEKLPQKVAKAEKARRKRWRAEVKANDYVMTGSGSLSSRGFPLNTLAHKNRLKEKILTQQEERDCEAKIIYQNEQIDLQSIDQIDEPSVRTTIKFQTKYYYTKKFDLEKTECIELEVIISPL